MSCSMPAVPWLREPISFSHMTLHYKETFGEWWGTAGKRKLSFNMCRKCVRPDSRPRRPSGLAIYLLAARPGRTGSAAGRAP